MTKSKSGGLARLPREQRCHFLIGPVSSWFMPNTTDLWTQSTRNRQENNTVINVEHDTVMDCDNRITGSESENSKLSYFAYGSIGCFCYGEIHRSQQQADKQQSSGNSNQISAIVNQLVDIKDDNSRVSCVRFLKDSPFPLVLALTESGSLIIHDCFQNENLVHFKRNEILTKFIGLSNCDGDTTTNDVEQHNAKRAKFNVTQQINSCAWPRSDTIFLGVSLLREKTCLLLRLKLNNIINLRNKPEQIENNSIVLEHEKIDLDLQPYASPLCLIESAMLDEKVCIVAAGMDDGMITVVSINLETNQKLRTIKLARHRDQICSLSLHLGNANKFPIGLLASVSRDGLVLVWNIENENYFADYMVATGGDNRGTGVRVNWFALRFLTVRGLKSTCLAVSNVDSGLTILEIPENTRSKIRLMENRDSKLHKRHQTQNDQTLKHNALIFNIEYDAINETLITSSLDGNHILWSLQQQSASSANQSNRMAPIEVKPRFLSPAMLNNARTHMLRHSPIKEDLLCMALGKGGIKFHSISENLIDSRFDMSQSCAFVARRMAKANASPLSIAWHPNHEYRLAIGTLDGKVYRADITPRKAGLAESQPTKVVATGQSGGSNKIGSPLDSALDVDYQPISREGNNSSAEGNNQRQSKTDGVYSLCWGPNPASPQDITKHAIYAVGSVSHKLFIYCNNKDNCDKLTNYLDEFYDKSLPEAQNRASEVAWKSSMGLMALGTTDGRIIVATYLDESHQERSNNRLFKILAIVSGPMGDAYIQCLIWHPTADSDDANYYKIVASSNESPGFVFNLKETILVADVKERLKLEQFNGSPNDNTCTTTATTNMLSAYVNKLEGHQKAISDIAWNPHEPNQLATCSFDRTCYVWSLDGCLMDAQIISKFSARDRLFTLEWSLVDADLIYTSGNDSIIWAWRPTQNRVKKN